MLHDPSDKFFTRDFTVVAPTPLPEEAMAEQAHRALIKAGTVMRAAREAALTAARDAEAARTHVDALARAHRAAEAHADRAAGASQLLLLAPIRPRLPLPRWPRLLADVGDERERLDALRAGAVRTHLTTHRKRIEAVEAHTRAMDALREAIEPNERLRAKEANDAMMALGRASRRMHLARKATKATHMASHHLHHRKQRIEAAQAHARGVAALRGVIEPNERLRAKEANDAMMALGRASRQLHLARLALASTTAERAEAFHRDPRVVAEGRLLRFDFDASDTSDDDDDVSYTPHTPSSPL